MAFFTGWLFRGVVLTAVLVLALIGGWWFFVRESAAPADSAPEIPDDLVSPSPAGTPSPGTTATAATTTPTAVREPVRYEIMSDRSSASYFAGEKLASLPLPSTARGTTSDI